MINFSSDYYRDEVRNGFYIPTAIKQAWAAGLVVLSEIDRICKKYDITYFADWGTLLGAVRHGGFVPWDDDLDICMKREDFNKFKNVAYKELPKEFDIHDYEHKENHWLFLTRIVNSKHICFDESHLEKYHNYPYIASVDIFIQDYLYKDSAKERERCDEIKRLIAVADGVVDGTMSSETISRELQQFEEKYNVYIDRNKDAKSIGILLYTIAEQQMARVPEEESDMVGQIFPCILKGMNGKRKKYYEKIVRLPFENTTIPVPADYDAILTSRYGEYLEIKKGAAGHDYPYFEKQREQLQAVSDFELPKFEFTQDMLDVLMTNDKAESAQLSKESYKMIIQECLEHLDVFTQKMIELNDQKRYEDILSMLPECQQMAVDMGTYIESIRGEDDYNSIMAVRTIQEYCDSLYSLYQEIAAGENKNITGIISIIHCSVVKMKDSVQRYILDRKEVLFLPTGPLEWSDFSHFYFSETSDDNNDVYVVPMPELFKDSYGRVKVIEKDIIESVNQDKYPKNLVITGWNDYDIKLHCPDKVYIQNPYDSNNPCLTIPPQYYAKNVRQYTEELVYVSSWRVDDFSENDSAEVYNMKHYVTAPGVIYADKVYVKSDNMKTQYLRKLTDFAGENTYEYWKKKICVVDIGNKRVDNNVNESLKKKIFYCIGINELFENKDKILDSVKERFELFNSNRDYINVTVALNPLNINEWRRLDKQIIDELLSLIKKYVGVSDGKNNNWCELREMKLVDYNQIVDEHNAYYGSASPLVPLFVKAKKTVMISKY